MIATADEFVRLRGKNDERATRDAAPEAVWMDIIRKYPDMRVWVAHNKTVPASVLEVLASDSDPDVRLVVAMKRKCEPAILELLARDTDERVRERVVFNAKTPVPVLEILAKDPSERIADAATVRLQSRGAPLPTGHETAGLTTTYREFSSLQQREGKVIGKPVRFCVVDGWVKSVDHLAEVEVSLPH
jgi:hypothetical protein